MRRLQRAPWVIVAVALLAPAAPARAADDPQYQVTVRRSDHGIPHVLAGDWGSLGYGYGRSLAEDNICVLADSYVTVRGERSRYFGESGRYSIRGNSSTANNLNSDFFYKRIIDEGIVERMIDQPPPHGPVPEIRELVRGYVDGYNAYLQATGVENLPDPTCRGKEWVKPIEEIDAYRRFYQLALLASSGVAIDGIGGARPLTGSPEEQGRAMGDLDRLDDPLGALGSNAYGLGSEATESGGGMLLGNPHFPWDGSERFYQAHLTLPKEKLDVAGGSLLGVPLVLIGHTRGMAWSHTVSTARRFTIFEETLVPGSPTTYLVDGRPERMRATTVEVEARTAGGELVTRRRTLYATRHGWVLTSILGLPIFPWTASTAFTMGDVNAVNFRYLNHFFFTGLAQSVDRLDQIERSYQGIPWVNTIAADSRGKAYYADIGAVPHVTDDHLRRCSTALGVATDQAARLFVLDGRRSECDWGSDPDAVSPGILGPGRMPSLLRDDFTSNMNDSYWLTNPRQPIEGFDRVIGDERTTRSPRTRLGLRILLDRFDGSDKEEGRRFTLRRLQDAMFNNRQYLGELWRDELVAMCRSTPVIPASNGEPVDVREACPILERWNLRDDIGSQGAVLFRRFAELARRATGGPWRVPFDARDPVNTPAGLNTGHPEVRKALADAVQSLRASDIPLDVPLGAVQYEPRNGERIPIHGGPDPVGVFNAINVGWRGEAGYSDVGHGTSFVQAVELDGRCATARTILTYSQSANPQSPYFADQTWMYSRKEWNEPPFCDMARAHFHRTLDLGGGVRASEPHGRVLRRVRVRGGRLSFQSRWRARVTVVVRRGSRVVQRVSYRGVRSRTVALRPGSLVEVRAAGRRRTHSVVLPRRR